jgi:competence ComEA-like helix-hairpin-helix protein
MRSTRQSFAVVVATLVIFLAGASCRRAVVVVNPPSAPAVSEGRPLLNLNRANAAELEALPGVGPQLAAAVIAHREAYGPLRRVEHLLLVQGFSEKRLRVIRPLVSVE